MDDIFLITIESIRRDRFDSDRFPECWQFFESEFAQFTDAYANGVATPLSFPSIHIGQSVVGDGTLPSDSPTIAELHTGYTWGISNSPHLRKERGYHRGFDYFTDRIHENKRYENRTNELSALDQIKDIASNSDLLTKIYRRYLNATAEPPSEKHNQRSITVDTLAELKSVLNDRKEGLFWVHLGDSHYPFNPWKVLDEEFEVSYEGTEIENMNDRFINKNPNPEDIDFLTDMYDELIKFVDRKLADFLSYLKETDRYDDALIFILSDHGEAFGEDGIFAYPDGVFSHPWDADPIDSLVRVPLLVKYPQLNHGGNEFTHPVQNGDVLATLAERLGWAVETPSLTQPFTEPGSRIILSKSNTAVRVTTETGYAVRQQDETKVFGDVSSKAIAILDKAQLPSVENLSGDVPGIDKREKEQLNRRLEYLGYK